MVSNAMFLRFGVTFRVVQSLNAYLMHTTEIGVLYPMLRMVRPSQILHSYCTNTFPQYIINVNNRRLINVRYSSCTRDNLANIDFNLKFQRIASYFRTSSESVHI